MNAKEIALAVAGVSFAGALYLLWLAWRQIREGQDRHRRIHQSIRALDGSHEACDLPAKDELVFERYASRYAGLGEGVTR